MRSGGKGREWITEETGEGNVRVHIVGAMLSWYAGILECDVMGTTTAKIVNHEGKWDVRMGGGRNSRERGHAKGRGNTLGVL